MICASTLQIRMYEYFSDLEFILLFVVIFLLYVINMNDVSLFAGF